MVFIKLLKPRILCSVIVAMQTGALPSKVRVVGSGVCGQGPARLSGGPSYHRLRPLTFQW